MSRRFKKEGDVCEIREFALEFYAPDRLVTVASVDKQLEGGSGYTYDVAAEIVSSRRTSVSSISDWRLTRKDRQPSKPVIGSAIL